MSSYDLIYEPWLPVRLLGGSRTVLSLRDVLARAHDICELATGAPLETIALDRFLLAVAHHAFPELADEDDWLAHYEEGQFPVDRLDAYFTEHETAFDLLDPERPFYQHPESIVRDSASVSSLFYDRSTGNNVTLFSHDLDDAPAALPADAAARALVTAQAFGAASVSGLAGADIRGGRLPNFKYAPLVGMAIWWMRGESLFGALLLNAPPSDKLRVWRDDPKDAPAWARPLPPPDERVRPPDGLLDYLTAQSRRILLSWSEQEGELVATSVRISQGDKLEPTPDEPMAAYRGTQKKGTYPLGLRKDRALWRDMHVFLGTPDRDAGRAGHPPRTLEWVANAFLELGSERARDRPVDVDVFGMVNDRAKVELWRHERFPFYLSFLRDEPFAIRRRKILTNALDYANAQAAGPLYKACFAFARRLRFPGYDGGSLGRQEREEVRAYVESLGADRLFWSTLQQAFEPFMERLARAREEPEAEAAAASWRTTVVRNVWQAFTTATGSQGTTAAAFQARAESEEVLRHAYSSTKTLEDT